METIQALVENGEMMSLANIFNGSTSSKKLLT